MLAGVATRRHALVAESIGEDLHTHQVRSGRRLNSCGTVTEIPQESGHPQVNASLWIPACEEARS